MGNKKIKKRSEDQSVAHQYIYDSSAEKIFYEKLEDFHEKYVDSLIMSGLSEKGNNDLESIKMIKGLQASEDFCKRVVGGLTNVIPEMVVKLFLDKSVRLECIFTKLNDGEHLDNVFMIQNVIDWPQLGHYSCQIWFLGETGMGKVKEYWDE